MKKLFYFLILIVISGTLIVSCEKETEDINQTPGNQLTTKTKSINNKSGGTGTLSVTTHSDEEIEMEYDTDDYTFTIDGSVTSISNSSTLVITKKSNNTDIYELEVDINLSTENYTRYTRNNLVAHSDSMLTNTTLTSSELSTLANLLIDFAYDFIVDTDEESYYNESTNSVFYHLSIFQMVNRAKSNSDLNCSCSSDGKYLLNKSPFVCTEDLFYSSGDIEDYFTDLYLTYDSLELDSAGADSIIAYVVANPNSQISQHTIESIVLADNTSNGVEIDTTSQGLFRFRCRNSASLGCCGNNGPNEPCGTSWYGSKCQFLCFLHDLACIRCGETTGGITSVFCGPDCAPSI